MNENSPSAKPLLTEDWTSVVLGFTIIAALLAGLKMPTPVFGWSGANDITSKVFATENLTSIVIQFFFLFAIALAGVYLLRKSLRNLVVVFTVVFLITQLALLAAGHAQAKAFNLEPVIFSLLLGLLIGNIFSLPQWFRDLLTTELFVKVGLVLLGTTIILADLLKAGALGLIQALLVVLSVWYFAFWVCRRLRLDDELTMMLCSAVSICGVSAAIATAGAIKGDSKKLSYVISLVLVTAIPMMLFMPYLAEAMGLTPEVTGAWIGGTIDTTGAVVAAGSMAGEAALKTSTIVKFSQNVLLGLAAFAISLYWTYTQNTTQEKPSAKMIWERFPKFVIGFIAACLLFSILITPEDISAVKDSMKGIQTAFFALAFTCIGLETKFADLFNAEGRKPLYAFLIAQTFNILVTLVLAYFLFG